MAMSEKNKAKLHDMIKNEIDNLQEAYNKKTLMKWVFNNADLLTQEDRIYWLKLFHFPFDCQDKEKIKTWVGSTCWAFPYFYKDYMLDILTLAEPFISHLFPLVCPENGSFIGYKFAYAYPSDEHGCMRSSSFESKRPNRICLIELEIPKDAKRSSGLTNKCRCDKAIVKKIELYNVQYTLPFRLIYDRDINVAVSSYDPFFHYEKGEEVKINNFNENRWAECSTGIHFFMTKEEVIHYIFQ